MHAQDYPGGWPPPLEHAGSDPVGHGARKGRDEQDEEKEKETEERH